jgi:hypothetical protein
MAKDLLQQAIHQAGIARAFEVLDLDDFLGVIDQADVYDTLANGSFYRFLESIVQPSTFPATWQKLSDLDWSDDDIAGLVDGGLIVEAASTLIAAINMGALSRTEYDEFSNYPNQEVEIFFYAKPSYDILSWLQGKVTLPKISKDAFSD